MPLSSRRWSQPRTTRTPGNRSENMRRKQGREIVVVERAGDSSAKWLFWGAALGAGLAQQFGAGKELLPELDDEDEEDLFGMPEPPAARGRAPASAGSAREELERR